MQNAHVQKTANCMVSATYVLRIMVERTSFLVVNDNLLNNFLNQSKHMVSHSIAEQKRMDVLKKLMKREPIFHRPEYGITRKDFENMTEATFWEVGASGRHYNREYVLDELEKRFKSPTEDIWKTKDFDCLEIATDNYLITYTLIQGDRITRRATIWRRSNDNWKIVYHQGTIVEDRKI